MTNQAFRFLHASDFRLHEPCLGLVDPPSELVETLIDAPFQAVQRVVDTALTEQVEFVVLSGEIVHPYLGGARSIAFLLEQFQRLDAQGIRVYWAGGTLDPPDQWPASVTLPDNVTFFPRGRVTTVTHHRDDQPLAVLAGRSCLEDGRIHPGEFAANGPGPFRIAVACGSADTETLVAHDVNYWALGGRYNRETPMSKQPVAHYPGSPQGRSIDHDGPHGCTMVRVDAEGGIRTQQSVTDVLRWRTEKITLDSDADRQGVERRLHERAQLLLAENSDRPLLIRWQLGASGKMGAALRHSGLDRELISWLNQSFARSTPAVWTVDIQTRVTENLPAAWYEEDTILGDFLRSVRRMQADNQPLDLSEFLEDRSQAGILANESQLNDATQREQVLRDVAILGADLLRPEV
jgi:DNA repair exonuclease SbcCD nuclease subunit